MTDKEILDWMDKEKRGIWFNPQVRYWTIQDSQKHVVSKSDSPSPIRIAIEACVNAEPVTDS